MAGIAVLRRLLSATSALGRAGGRQDKQMLSRIKNELVEGAREEVEKILEGATDEEITTVMGLVERNAGLTPQARHRLAGSVRAARPELYRTQSHPWKQNAIYTTREGLDRRREEYERIVDERMPEVIREIGEAAELGDLSENAEYTAALEERSRLSEKAGEIKDEMRRARVIPPDMAEASYVTIGSRVRARRMDTGEEETLTFLGPWDADPKNGIYSYKAPLSLTFMGAAEGDTVTLERDHEQTSWEILEIESAL
jgi:transcription elongation GreA/GreB family factor